MALRTRACRRTRSAEASPLALARELVDLADDQIALDAAQPVHEQLAVEVIHLVLKGAREQPGPFVLKRLALTIEPLHDGAHRTHHRRVEPRDAEAAFFFQLHAIA